MAWKRSEQPKDTILRISSSRNAIIVQEHTPGGAVSYREIDPIELYFALNESYTSDDYLDSGFLPENCLHLSMNAAERRYVIWNPELRADVIYRDLEYPDFPLPRQMKSPRKIRRCFFTRFLMSTEMSASVRGTMCCLDTKSFQR